MATICLCFAVFCVAALAAQQGWYPHEGGLLKYRVQIRFGEEPDTMPEGWKFGRVSAVATGLGRQCLRLPPRHEGRSRSSSSTPKGKYLRSLGQGHVRQPARDSHRQHDHVWVTDTGHHLVMEFTNGGQAAADPGHERQGRRRHDTFNRPTDVAFPPNGDFFVSDGYGNSRVVKFSRDGKYLLEWGKRGTGPGEFDLPH